MALNEQDNYFIHQYNFSLQCNVIDNNDMPDDICCDDEQSMEESKQTVLENEEMKKQIEEDADRELLNMRIRHEHLFHDQQVRHNSPAYAGE